MTVPGNPPIQRDETLNLKLVARPLPQRMPVMMWGIGSPAEFADEFPRLQELGFTQCLGFGADFLVIPQPIEQLNIAAPESAQPGEPINVAVTIADSSGEPVSAVIPLRVDITDPAGRPAEWSGFYGAANGILKLNLDIADNDATGVWQIRVRELASGRIAPRYVRVGNAGE